MFTNLIKKYKSAKQEKEIFNIWQKNITYINNLEEHKVVVTSIEHDKSLFILIFLSKKVFFMEKVTGIDFNSISGEAHENMIKNDKIWECVKFSKTSGNIMDTSSLMLYIASILERNKERLEIDYNEEKDIWFDICHFINEMKTLGVKIPTYKRGENIWVD